METANAYEADEAGLWYQCEMSTNAARVIAASIFGALVLPATGCAKNNFDEAHAWFCRDIRVLSSLDEDAEFYANPPDRDDQRQPYCADQAHSTMLTYASLNALEQASLILSEARSDGELGEDIGLPLQLGDLTFGYERKVIRARDACLEGSFERARSEMDAAQESAWETLGLTLSECERRFPSK